MPNTLPPGMTPFPLNPGQIFTTGTIDEMYPRGRKKSPEKQDDNIPMKARKGFTFGADPEFFLVNDKNVIVPGTPDLIPGTKLSPYPVNKGAIQLDGIAAEINIDAAETFEEWSENLDAVVAALKKMLPKNWSLSTKASHVFDKEVWDAIPDECKILGCSPDFNAWEMTLNDPPEITDPYLRCIGGHIHVGWPGGPFDVTEIQHILACVDLTKQFDWFLAYWALKHDQDKARRLLYGKTGACRIKPYGMEYRVLSSFWVLDKALRLEVWNRIQHAINNMTDYFMPDRGHKKWNSLLREGVDTGEYSSSFGEGVASFPVTTMNTRYSRL